MLHEITDPIVNVTLLTLIGRATGWRAYDCLLSVCPSARCTCTILTMTLARSEEYGKRPSTHVDVTIDPIYRSHAELRDVPKEVTAFGRLVA